MGVPGRNKAAPSQTPGRPTAWARKIHLLVALLFVGSVVVQVFLAGRALFVGAEHWPEHVSFGYSVVGPLALAVALSSLVARVPRPAAVRAWLLFVAYVVQTLLPGLRETAPLVSALHPVNALLIFWLGITVASRAYATVRIPVAIGEPARSESST